MIKAAILIYSHPMHGDSGIRRLNLVDKGMRELIHRVYAHEASFRLVQHERAMNQYNNEMKAISRQIRVSKDKYMQSPHAQQQAAFQSHVRQANIERAISHGEKQSPLMKKIKELRDGLMGTSKRGKTGLMPIDTRLGEKSALTTPNLPSK